MHKLPVGVVFAGVLMGASTVLAAAAPPPQKTADQFERELGKATLPPAVENAAAPADARCPAGKVWDEEFKWCDQVPTGSLAGYNLGLRHTPSGPSVAAAPAPVVHSIRAASAPRHVMTPAAPDTKSDLLVQFENRSADLTQQSRANVAEFAKYMGRDSAKETRIEIDGHTNAVGSRPYNLALSSKRAEAVKDYLVKLGVDSSRLEARGLGFDQPLIKDASSPENRRVEAHVLQ